MNKAAALLLCGALLLVGSSSVRSQSGGDQILDGIGETALVARYVFNGDANDASRNALHATLRGAGGVGRGRGRSTV